MFNIFSKILVNFFLSVFLLMFIDTSILESEMDKKNIAEKHVLIEQFKHLRGRLMDGAHYGVTHVNHRLQGLDNTEGHERVQTGSDFISEQQWRIRN